MHPQPRGSLSFLSPVYYVASFFAVTPPYDFEKKTIKRKTFSKVYSLLLATMILVFSPFVYYCRYNRFIKKLASTSVVDLEFFSEVTAMLANVVILLASCHWNMDAWAELLAKLACLEDYTTCRGVKACWRSGTAVFVAINVFSLLINTFFYLMSPELFVLIIEYTIYSYLQLLVYALIYQIVSFIRCQYKEMNDILKGLNSESENVVKSLEVLLKRYLELQDCVELFNRIFGLPILLLVFSVFLMMLTLFSLITIDIKNSHLDFDVMRCWPATNFLYGINIFFGPLIVMFCCDFTVMEARKILTTCLKMEGCVFMTRREILELKSLKEKILECRPVFSAAGYFEINRTVFLKSVNTLTTYLIVINQLNSSSMRDNSVSGRNCTDFGTGEREKAKIV